MAGFYTGRRRGVNPWGRFGEECGEQNAESGEHKARSGKAACETSFRRKAAGTRAIGEAQLSFFSVSFFLPAPFLITTFEATAFSWVISICRPFFSLARS